MNLSTKTLFTHGIDKLCTICHVILTDSDCTHSMFSTLEELESPEPMNVLQVLQSFSNFNCYNGTQMVCTMCYDKTIEVYKFIQMCNKAHEIMHHYSKNVEAITTRKDETDVGIKIEKISTAPTGIIILGREFVKEMDNEKISKFDELGMDISGPEIKIEERILQEGMEKDEIKAIQDQMDVDVKVEEISTAPTRIIIDGREVVMENKKISKFDELGMVMYDTEIKIEERMEKEETSNNISHTEIVTEEKIGSRDFCKLRVEKIDAQMHDERMGLIKCKDCHLVFSDKKELGGHEKEAKHTKEKPFLNKLRTALFGAIYNSRSHDLRHNCPECHEVFSIDKELEIHMRTSHTEKLLCNDCGKMFTTKSHLNTHIQVHSGDSHNAVKVKVHKCAQCDRQFTRAAHLRNHMDIHTGVKAYKCEQCDRRFTQASTLRGHMNIHSGVKAHKCEICDRRFTHSSNLHKHMDIHHGLKAHKCVQCDRRYSHALNLRAHMRTHNEVKLHKCEQCDRRFIRAANLRRHMYSHK